MGVRVNRGVCNRGECSARTGKVRVCGNGELGTVRSVYNAVGNVCGVRV